MMKRALMFAFLVSALLFVSGKADEEEKEENEENPFTSLFTENQLKKYAENLEKDIIQPKNLTCENYENYCKTSIELGSTDDCNMFLKMYLCDDKRDPKGLKDIINEIFKKIKAADEAETMKAK